MQIDEGLRTEKEELHPLAVDVSTLDISKQEKRQEHNQYTL